MPLEVLMRRMQAAWEAKDYDKACALARDACPYMHPKLASIDAHQTGRMIIEFVQIHEDAATSLDAIEYAPRPPTTQ